MTSKNIVNLANLLGKDGTFRRRYGLMTLCPGLYLVYLNIIVSIPVHPQRCLGLDDE